MCVMAQVTTRWLLMQGSVLYHILISVGFVVNKLVLGHFCLSTSVLLCQYLSTKVPRIYLINLTLTLYNISN
jgi:hypothetical protein